jgi:hypothetical protein
MANRKITFSSSINASVQATDLLYSHTDGNAVANPTFASVTQAESIIGDEWTTQVGWTIGSNKLIGTSVPTGQYAIAPSKFGLKSGKTYTVTYTLSGAITGGVKIHLYGEGALVIVGADRTSAATYTETLTIPTSGTGAYTQSVLFVPSATFTGNIENVFVSNTSTVKDVKSSQLVGKVTSVDKVNNTITYVEDTNATALGGSGDFVLFAKNKNINQNGIKGRYATIKFENNAGITSKMTDLSVGAIESSN